MRIALVAAALFALAGDSTARDGVGSAADRRGSTSSPQVTASQPPGVVGVAATVAIGSDRQLFLDDRLLDVGLCRDLTRTLNPPRSTHRVLMPDQPWETLGLAFHGSVVDDGEEVRLYYDSYSWDGKIRRHSCLATSKDGYLFERPRLGLQEFAGSKENNLLPLVAPDANVFLDPRGAPGKRYRMLYSPFGPADVALAGVYTATSPDGLTWAPLPARLLPFALDSQPSIYWDDALGKYVVYLRAWERELGKREVCRVAVDDTEKPWPYRPSATPYRPGGQEKATALSRELPSVMAADGQDPDNLDIYTSVVAPYPWAPGVLLAFPAVYLRSRGPEWQARGVASTDGNFEVQLATSVDGVAWTRWRQPYVAAEAHDCLDLRLVSMMQGMVRRRRWIYQYFVGWPYTRGRPDVWAHDPQNAADWMRKDRGGIYMAMQRVDGFVSLDSPDSGGVLTTRPLTFAGDRLCLNLSARGVGSSRVGSARVALLDAAGAAIPGFSAAECDPISTDATDYIVRWNGRGRVGALAGKPIRVQVTMQNTKLYALQFVPAD